MKIVIENLYNAYAKFNIPAVLSELDDQIVWNEAEGNPYADGNPYRGKVAILNGVFARLGTEWKDLRLLNIKLHEMADNQVLATLRYNGEYIKTSTCIDAQAAHLWTLKDGKVIRFQQYVDTRQLAKAMNA